MTRYSSRSDNTLNSCLFHLIFNPPAVQETRAWSLGWEDPLEKGMAVHSNILAWRIQRSQRSLAGYNPWGCKEVRQKWVTNTFTFDSCWSERKQIFLLEKPVFAQASWTTTDILELDTWVPLEPLELFNYAWCEEMVTRNLERGIYLVLLGN